MEKQQSNKGDVMKRKALLTIETDIKCKEKEFWEWDWVDEYERLI